jgi:hypothetical protein
MAEEDEEESSAELNIKSGHSLQDVAISYNLYIAWHFVTWHFIWSLTTCTPLFFRHNFQCCTAHSVIANRLIRFQLRPFEKSLYSNR